MDKCDEPTCPLCYPGVGCIRELKPGVEKAGHKLTDHVDYAEEAEKREEGAKL